MENAKLEDCAYRASKRIAILKSENTLFRDTSYKILMFFVLIGIWQLTAMHFDLALIMPYPLVTFKSLIDCMTDIETIKNIMITMDRVIRGFLWALLIGAPLGFLMGAFPFVQKLIGGFIDSIRQVPIMAWVPLTIVWFGIGNGPTIFIIALSGVFPIILNTVSAVQNIDKDYYNAARTMGARPINLFFNVMLPAAIPDILTGARIAISAGWMSVI